MPAPRLPDTCRYCPKPMARRNNGLRRVCTECNQKRKFWYTYGVTIDFYNQLLDSQEGLCAICHRPERALRANGEVRKLSIDHDHNSGVIRGLLCYHCNQGLGHFEDNAQFLRAAAIYALQDQGGKQLITPSTGLDWLSEIPSSINLERRAI